MFCKNYNAASNNGRKNVGIKVMKYNKMIKKRYMKILCNKKSFVIINDR